MRNLNVVETVVLLKEGKTITTPSNFSIDNTNYGSWLSVFNSEMKRTTIGLGEYDPVKKIKMKINGLQGNDPGLKPEEIDDKMILGLPPDDAKWIRNCSRFYFPLELR